MCCDAPEEIDKGLLRDLDVLLEILDIVIDG